MKKNAEEKALQRGANIERGAIRKKVKAMRIRLKKQRNDEGVKTCLELWEFMRYRELRTRKKTGGI